MIVARHVRASVDRCRFPRGSPPGYGFVASCRRRYRPRCRTPDTDGDGGGDASVAAAAVDLCLELAVRGGPADRVASADVAAVCCWRCLLHGTPWDSRRTDHRTPPGDCLCANIDRTVLSHSRGSETDQHQPGHRYRPLHRQCPDSSSGDLYSRGTFDATRILGPVRRMSWTSHGCAPGPRSSMRSRSSCEETDGKWVEERISFKIVLMHVHITFEGQFPELFLWFSMAFTILSNIPRASG